VLAPVFDRKALGTAKVIAKGLPAGPGAATGRMYLNADRAVQAARKAKRFCWSATKRPPEDLRGMIAAEASSRQRAASARTPRWSPGQMVSLRLRSGGTADRLRPLRR
jgi:hypothetical protein